METARRNLTPAEALRVPGHLNRRLLLGTFISLLATTITLSTWTSLSSTRPVLVATRDLPVGAKIGASDLTTAQVNVPDAVYAASVPASEQPALIGKQVTEPVHAGQIVQSSQASEGARLGQDQMAMTIAVGPEVAAGGTLQPGDHVQVLVTRNKGEPNSTTEVVLPSPTVYTIGYDPTSYGLAAGNEAASSGEPGTLSTLTLILSSQDALKLANAKWNGDLDVVLLPPTPR